MSHIDQVLLMASLGLNGFWIGAKLTKPAQGSSRRLGTITLILLGASLLLFSPGFVIPSQSVAVQVTQALSSILSAACVWCFVEWEKLQPAPWGPGRKKTQVR